MVATANRSDNLSHGSLFLRIGEEDLVNEFVKVMVVVFKGKPAPDSNLLSLEPEGGRPNWPEFASSDAAYDRLCDSADRLGVRGFGRFDKEAFMGVLLDAFDRARMDERATTELLPYAKVALNAELEALYAKLTEFASPRPGS